MAAARAATLMTRAADRERVCGLIADASVVAGELEAAPLYPGARQRMDGGRVVPVRGRLARSHRWWSSPTTSTTRRRTSLAGSRPGARTRGFVVCSLAAVGRVGLQLRSWRAILGLRA